MTKKVEETVETSKFELVNFIMDKLGLSDKGQFEKFFCKEIKILTRDIKSANQNINVEKSNLAIKLDALEEKIEDAEGDVRDAYANINISDIKNNKAIDDFRNSYWNHILDEEAKLAGLKELVITYKEMTKDAIDALKEEIKVRQARIDNINSFKK